MPKNDRAKLINDRLDWNLLRTFLVIVQEGGIGRAAVKLHITQPAVSHALKRLEEQLSRKLVLRDGANLRITDAGLAVKKLAEGIYGDISQLAEVEPETEVVSGQVRLLTVSGIEWKAYDHFLADFHRDYPKISLEVRVMRTGDIPSALSSHTATAAITLNRNPIKRLHQRVFMRQNFGLYCGRHHPLFGRKDLVLSDLADEDFVAFMGDQVGESLSALTYFREMNGLRGDIVATSASTAEIKRLIYAGYGVGGLPEYIGQREVAAERMMRLPPDVGIGGLDLVMLWSESQKFRGAERALLERLIAFSVDQAPEP